LKLDVPYTSLSSKPVTAKLDNVQICLQPITDRDKWDFEKLAQEEDLTKVEQAINEYVWNKYEEYKADAAGDKTDQGLNIGYAEMIVDNV
jgi:hypothetical protein